MEKKSGYWKLVLNKSWKNVNNGKNVKKYVRDFIVALLISISIQILFGISQFNVLISLLLGLCIWVLYLIVSFILNLLFISHGQIYLEQREEIEKYIIKNEIPIIIKKGRVISKTKSEIHQVDFVNIGLFELESCILRIFKLYEISNSDLIEISTNDNQLCWCNILSVK